jgi:hypothetical protein
MHDGSEGHKGRKQIQSRIPERQIEEKGEKQDIAFFPIISIDKEGQQDNGKILAHDRATECQETPGIPVIQQEVEGQTGEKEMNAVQMPLPGDEHQYQWIQGIKDQP